MKITRCGYPVSYNRAADSLHLSPRGKDICTYMIASSYAAIGCPRARVFFFFYICTYLGLGFEAPLP